MTEVATRVAVVVVTYNSSHDIEGFLDSLDALEGAPLRVIVCDNASEDNTLERVRNHPRDVDIVETGGNLGYSAAINAGVRHLDDDTMLVIANPDVRLHPGFLAAVRVAAVESTVGVVVPKLVDEAGHPQRSLRREPTVRRAFAEALLGGNRAARLGWGEVVHEAAAYAKPHNVEWAVGALLVVTPSCRLRVGAWDESFFLYSEETDYLLRVREAGFSIRYEPEAVAFHRGGASHVDPFLWTTLTRNRVRLFRGRHGALQSRAFWLATVLNEVLRAPRSETHRRAAADLLSNAGEILRRPPDMVT